MCVLVAELAIYLLTIYCLQGLSVFEAGSAAIQKLSESSKYSYIHDYRLALKHSYTLKYVDH